MRLIDADKLKEHIDKLPALPDGNFAGTHRNLKALINMQPTIEPERKKGTWIYGEDEYGIDGYHCDKCGFFVQWDYVHNFINYIDDYNFCPNCGSKMERRDG